MTAASRGWIPLVAAALALCWLGAEAAAEDVKSARPDHRPLQIDPDPYFKSAFDIKPAELGDRSTGRKRRETQEATEKYLRDEIARWYDKGPSIRKQSKYWWRLNEPSEKNATFVERAIRRIARDMPEIEIGVVASGAEVGKLAIRGRKGDHTITIVGDSFGLQVRHAHADGSHQTVQMTPLDRNGTVPKDRTRKVESWHVAGKRTSRGVRSMIKWAVDNARLDGPKPQVKAGDRVGRRTWFRKGKVQRVPSFWIKAARDLGARLLTICRGKKTIMPWKGADGSLITD